MGIRYFAHSIDTEDYERISAGPCLTCGTRQHPREREWNDPEQETLDLDKSFHSLLHVFDSLGLCAAAELVTGRVTQTWSGWDSYQGTIAPDRVGQVLAELTSVSPSQLRSFFRDGSGWKDDRAEQDCAYVGFYLNAAAEFLDKVAAERRGIVYYIG